MKLRVLFKAFGVSMTVKGAASMLVAVLGFAAALLPVLLAERLRDLTDELQILTGSRGSASPALTAFAALAALYLLQVLFSNIQQYYAELDTINLERFIKRTILRLKCDVRYKYIENCDDFQKRIAFAEQYAGEQLAKSINNTLRILQMAVVVLTVGIALWQVSPITVAVLVVTSVPAALLSYFQQDETFRARAKWMEEGTLVIHYFIVISGFAGMEALQEIRHFALYDYLKARWRALADDYVGLKNKIMAKHVKFNTAADFLRSVVYIGILLVTAWQIYRSPVIGLGVFTLVYTLSGQLQSATGEMLVGIMMLAQDIPYMQEFFALDEFERESYDDGSVKAKDGEITFSDVSFAYPNTQTLALKGITLKIRDGEKIAVVGENGSGKSTFISLLCGMFDPQQGQVEVGGISVRENPAAARRAVSVVFQDFAKYEASLRDNITVSDKARQASDGEIADLLKRINVYDVVAEQPDGLDELIGSFSDADNNLSGGQWQKISIARAAYRENAEIMVLDEPTAALDPIAEAQLYRNFAELTGDKTTILISHRLGITSLVDRVLVFDQGRIVEDGSHAALMARDGLYAKMYRAQAQWYDMRT